MIKTFDQQEDMQEREFRSAAWTSYALQHGVV